MYRPDAFREDRPSVLHALMRDRPLGLLITTGASGVTANPVPFALYPDEGPAGTLRAHVARANPQWRDLRGGAEAVVVFQGAEGYVTPTWYATKAETGRVMPTWNTATVEARGPARTVEDEGWLCRQVDDLTAIHEGRRPRPWSVADAPGPYVDALIRGIVGIVGIEVAVASLTGKWKVSQNQPPTNREGVARGFAADGSAEMAGLVEGAGPS